MTEKQFEVQFDGWHYFLVVDTINERCIARLDTKRDADAYLEIVEQNEELKLDNDIKFWKQEYLQLSNHQQVIFHELAEAFKQGYKPSKEYQKMRNDEKKRIEECKQKMERLKL